MIISGLLDRPVVYYLHIPKTGGNSLRLLFYYNTDDESFVDSLIQTRVDGANGHPLTWRSSHPEIEELTRVVSGHSGQLLTVCANTPFGLHHRTSKRFAYCTFLREPVARARSYWKFVYSNRDGDNLWKVWEDLDLDVSRIIRHPSGTGLVNDQTRMISGSGQFDLDKTDLQDALENLRTDFFFVGDFAHFDTQVLDLASILGWQHLDVPRLNVARLDSASSVPRDFDEVISNANALDRRLYATATDSQSGYYAGN